MTHTARRRHGAVHPRIVAALTLTVALVSGCAPVAPDPVPTPSPTATGPFPVVVIGALAPPQAVPAEFDEVETLPAVQVLRMTGIVLAWTNLIDSTEFAQFTQYIDPASEPNAIGLYELSAQDPYAPIGPTPYVVPSVTENPDGSTTVHTCGGRRPQVSKADGTPRPPSSTIGLLMDITLSPLTTEEVAELTDLDLDAPPLRVRHYQTVTGECDASAAVVQEFENWREVAPIGHYRDK